MNIFFLDEDPSQAAKKQIDKHVIKMIVESAQMLQTAYPLERLAKDDCPKSQNGNNRTHGYYNHPCAIWARSSRSNFEWLLTHACALYHEKKFRFGGDHFSVGFIYWCIREKPDIEDIGLTTPALAFKNYPHLRDYSNPVESYQKFYVQDKRRDNAGRWMAKYTKRPIPTFWGKYLDKEQLDEFMRMTED